MFPFISSKQSFSALEVFDDWNEEKKKIQIKVNEEKNLSEEQMKIKKVYINEREVWYMKLGQNL